MDSMMSLKTTRKRKKEKEEEEEEERNETIKYRFYGATSKFCLIHDD